MRSTLGSFRVSTRLAKMIGSLVTISARDSPSNPVFGLQHIAAAPRKDAAVIRRRIRKSLS